MMSCRNAKTNVYQHEVLIDRVRRHGWTQHQAAEVAGVSMRTAAQWLKWTEPLADRSSRPQRSPRRTRRALVAAITRLRRTCASAWQISAALGVPRSTVTRVLARPGLHRVAACEPMAPVERYEWAHAGDLRRIDMKRLGLDDATRLAYVEVLMGEDAITCVGCL